MQAVLVRMRNHNQCKYLKSRQVSNFWHVFPANQFKFLNYTFTGIYPWLYFHSNLFLKCSRYAVFSCEEINFRAFSKLFSLGSCFFTQTCYFIYYTFPLIKKHYSNRSPYFTLLAGQRLAKLGHHSTILLFNSIQKELK